MTRWIKIIGALLLFSCFALPMSSCTEHKDPKGHAVSSNQDGSYPGGTQTVTTRYYVFEQVKVTEPFSWLLVVALVWPAIFLIHARYRSGSRLDSVLWFTEPLLLGGSGFMIYAAAIFKTPDVGSYVGWAGIAVYFSGWAIEAVSNWRIWMRKRSLTNHSHSDAPKDDARFS